jgi:hypothetical protein
VIQEVINSSHIDFEESGVDQQTLEDLRKVSTRLCFYYQFSLFFGSLENPPCRVLSKTSDIFGVVGAQEQKRIDCVVGDGALGTSAQEKPTRVATRGAGKPLLKARLLSERILSLPGPQQKQK